MDYIADRIGYEFLKKGFVDYDTLEKALNIRETEDRKTRRNIAQILVDEFDFDHDFIFREVANIFAFRETRFDVDAIGARQIQFIRQHVDRLSQDQREIMVKSKIVPFKFDEKYPDKLIVLAADPTDRNIPKILHGFGAKKYEVCYCVLKDLVVLINKVLPRQDEFSKRSQEKYVVGPAEAEETAIDDQKIDDEINKSGLAGIVDDILTAAVREGASDVHVVPGGVNKTRFLFRIDGNLHHWYTQEGTRPEAVLAVFKDRSKGVDRFLRDKTQDGYMQHEVDGHLIRFRVSVMPLVAKEYDRRFESIVIRVLDDRKVITDLEKLGLQGMTQEFFNKAIAKPQGIVILTGPTGSGKSTTLIAALHKVLDPTLNVLTIEDPVEYLIEGARQLRIGPNMSFEEALRGILRHDPDIVLVGEMRDRMTADIAIKLANTGHLVFSTLHTNDAPSAVARLYKMGIEPFLIAYAINIIVAQRLIRILCSFCKRPIPERDKENLLKLGFPEEDLKNHTFYEAVGCERCSNGYKGRAAIHEALYFTKEIRNIILDAGEKVDENRIREQAAKDGMWTLRRSGMERMKEGITTLEEVAASTVEES